MTYIGAIINSYILLSVISAGVIPSSILTFLLLALAIGSTFPPLKIMYNFN